LGNGIQLRLHPPGPFPNWRPARHNPRRQSAGRVP
jgi:hypothetical protein